MGAFSHNVRRRHNQTALRSLLARSDLPLLPLRNSAPAQSAKLVSASFAAVDSQSRRALHSFCSTCGTVVLLRACATVLLGRRTDDPVPNYSHPERESFVAELHHHRPLHPVLRRSIPDTHHSHFVPRRRDRKHELTACNRRRLARCDRNRVKLAAGAQFVFPPATDERQL